MSQLSQDAFLPLSVTRRNCAAAQFTACGWMYWVLYTASLPVPALRPRRAYEVDAWRKLWDVNRDVLQQLVGKEVPTLPATGTVFE
jgi:hypothetical protein